MMVIYIDNRIKLSQDRNVLHVQNEQGININLDKSDIWYISSFGTDIYGTYPIISHVRIHRHNGPAIELKLGSNGSAERFYTAMERFMHG
jgi:hypothetical protein